MFNNERFLTKGVNTEVGTFLQFLLWDMIDEMEVEKKDYLQIFNLKPIIVDGDMVQEIIHTQEQPPYKRRIVLNKLTEPINAKIYVIDDGTHSTMLFPEER